MLERGIWVEFTRKRATERTPNVVFRCASNRSVRRDIWDSFPPTEGSILDTSYIYIYTLVRTQVRRRNRQAKPHMAREFHSVESGRIEAAERTLDAIFPLRSCGTRDARWKISRADDEEM